MAALLESKTISVSIERTPKDVYEFVSNPANLPKWASGLGTSIENVNGEWIARAPRGPVKCRFVERNDFGVLDHYVSPTPGVEVYIPMRVISNGAGSELIFTLLRQPDMSDAKFQEDAEWVQRDLNALKKLLEAEASESNQNA
ncbi:MAG: SRPBCC family protein [Deltaproteobacteria bacterium]|nr:SRPBCC family protein [Deltaproteobacteria bacterium]